MRALAAFALLFWLSGAACAATIHIVAFGDSATAGYLVPRDKAYPAQLRAALHAKGYDVTVKNAGMNGDTTRASVDRVGIEADELAAQPA